MSIKSAALTLLIVLLASCATNDNRGTIAELDKVKADLKDADVAGGLDKAMQGYQKFLEKTPESQLTPEAMRRLADLKIEKEYGVVTNKDDTQEADTTSSKSTAPEISTKAVSPLSETDKTSHKKEVSSRESDKEFEKRTTKSTKIKSSNGGRKIQLPKGEAGSDLANAGAEQAIKLYKKLLKKYPLYERNDQVLYQLSRAYEETGQVEKAMKVMNRLIKQYPHSRYNDEVNFRRGEYYFTRRKYLDAEDAYGEVLKQGIGTVYYERALYKKGWTFYKQQLYEEALKEFFELLDHKVSIGYDFEQKHNEIEKKRIEDTFRVVSLSFSNLGGTESIKQFFNQSGAREYEYKVYKELAEFYLGKRRYSDAANTYNAFIESNPFHKKSPKFSMRVIDIYMKGHFPKLVIDAKKKFASTYGLYAEYWNYFNQAEFPEVIANLKKNLTDLANYYHSLYQNKKYIKNKQENFAEASRWYREFLKSFPKDKESPVINYQLADLLLENKAYKEAAIEYEHSAYDYPVNEKSRKAAYQAVYAYRQYVKVAPIPQLKDIKKEIIRVSIRLVDTYPKHKKAAIVLGAAIDDLFNMRDFPMAIKVGRRLIAEYPNADKAVIRGAWLVVAHSSYNTEKYPDAEIAYTEVLKLTDKNDKTRVQLTENLAASIYKQGEQAKAAEHYKEAVKHFLRIADAAPNSKIRPTAEYDAAAVLIQIMDLKKAVSVLLSFRNNYPGNKLQNDVTNKLAYAYKELDEFNLAAKEYERVAKEGKNEELIREAMLEAAELYGKAKNTIESLRVYKEFVVMFPKPLEFALETYYKIAMIYKADNDLSNYRNTLRHIIKTDATAGKERTDRTKYLAAQSSLVIIEPEYDKFIALKLVKPFKKSLKLKQKSMKRLIKSYTNLVDYHVADVTAASTFYIAEIYYNFSRSLLTSEKPDNLNSVELEEFTTMLEDQAYPFEDKAIKVHEKNVELLSEGIYSKWIDRSIAKLAKLVPARFGKPEDVTSFISKIDNYIYFSPKYAREDGSTGFIENLSFFRYTSHISPTGSNENATSADISKQENSTKNGTLTGNSNGQNQIESTSGESGEGNKASGQDEKRKPVPAAINQVGKGNTQGNEKDKSSSIQSDKAAGGEAKQEVKTEEAHAATGTSPQPGSSTEKDKEERKTSETGTNGSNQETNGVTETAKTKGSIDASQKENKDSIQKVTTEETIVVTEPTPLQGGKKTEMHQEVPKTGETELNGSNNETNGVSKAAETKGGIDANKEQVKESIQKATTDGASAVTETTPPTGSSSTEEGKEEHKTSETGVNGTTQETNGVSKAAEKKGGIDAGKEQVKESIQKVTTEDTSAVTKTTPSPESSSTEKGKDKEKPKIGKTGANGSTQESNGESKAVESKGGIDASQKQDKPNFGEADVKSETQEESKKKDTVITDKKIANVKKLKTSDSNTDVKQKNENEGESNNHGNKKDSNSKAIEKTTNSPVSEKLDENNTAQ